MNAEFDDDLTSDQWEALKALRTGTPRIAVLRQSVLDDLIKLQLVTISEKQPIITSRGRTVLVRGSPRLWDVAV